MVEFPEELKEDLMRLGEINLEERPKKCGYFISVDPQGNWSFSPTLYEVKEKNKKTLELKRFEFKNDKAELKKKEKLSTKILDRLAKPIRQGIGREIKKALLEKPLHQLELMVATEGKIEMRRRRGCFFIVDEKNNKFSL